MSEMFLDSYSGTFFSFSLSLISLKETSLPLFSWQNKCYKCINVIFFFLFVLFSSWSLIIVVLFLLTTTPPQMSSLYISLRKWLSDWNDSHYQLDLSYSKMEEDEEVICCNSQIKAENRSITITQMIFETYIGRTL